MEDNEIIQIVEITEETVKKEKLDDDENFKIEFDINEEIKPREEKVDHASGPKRRIPFSCCHCEFVGNNRTELRKHKRDLDS